MYTKTRMVQIMYYYYHWRQRRPGCRGHIPSNILVGGDVNHWEYPHQYYYVLSGIADQC